VGVGRFALLFFSFVALTYENHVGGH